MDSLTFTPQQAWQATLSNLEKSMQKATFDTWIKPVCLVSFEGDTFTIGCNNQDSLDWLADRMTITLERTLCGFMCRPIKVCFVVLEKNRERGIEVEETLTNIDKDGDEDLALDVHYNSIRNSLLEPERVVRLPVYFLRWLPYVQSQMIFVVMALWQEYYLASRGKTQKGNNKVSVRAEQVCQWAGISRAQFFRLLQPGSKLEWFARKCETDHEIDKRTGHTKKSANKYILFETTLTPGDAADLKSYLLSQGILESPITALQAAIVADPKQILRYPVRLPPDTFENMLPCHLTVQDVVRDLIGHRLSGEFMMLTDQLSDRLLAQGEFILVSWYFLKNWLPILGPDVAMFILVLRTLCYFNDEAGEVRDEVWIEGGYEAIAQKLGIKNSRTVSTWLPAKVERGKRKDELTQRTNQEFARRLRLQDLLSQFVQRTDHRINSAGCYAWKFKVLRTEPLTPQDEMIRLAASSLLATSEEKGTLDELGAWITKVSNDCSASARLWRETVKSEPKVVFGLSQLTNVYSETLSSILKDCLATLDLEDKDCFETLLKTLKGFKDSYKDKDSSSTQDSLSSSVESQFHQSVEVVTDVKGEWCLEKLLARADKKNRQILLAQEKNALPFVSWVIHGASQASIQNPYSLAIAKLKTNPGISAGGACDRLAVLPPHRLVNLIGQELTFDSPCDPNWRILFTQTKPERVRLLVDSLGLELEIQDESLIHT